MANNPAVPPASSIPQTYLSESEEPKKEPKEGDTVTDMFGIVWVYRNGQYVMKAGQKLTDPVTGKQYEVVRDGVIKEVKDSEVNPLGNPPKVPAGQKEPPTTT